MKKCNYCGRENPDDQDLCIDCATELTPGQRATSATPPEMTPEEAARAQAKKRMRNGALWFTGGIILTTVTYLSAIHAPNGGTYIIAWGAILFGAVRFFQGLFGGKPPSSEDFGYEALAYATRLETEGRMQEALDSYQKIVETYPDTAAGLDARKSLDNLRAKLG